MLVHVLCGQWPIPTEPTRVDPCNPAHVIGLSEVERRAEYLDVIGRPSAQDEGHPLMPLIERCLSNSPDCRPKASELVETMGEAAEQQPLTFNSRVNMMQRIENIQREKRTFQAQILGTQVSREMLGDCGFAGSYTGGFEGLEQTPLLVDQRLARTRKHTVKAILKTSVQH